MHDVSCESMAYADTSLIFIWGREKQIIMQCVDAQVYS